MAEGGKEGGRGSQREKNRLYMFYLDTPPQTQTTQCPVHVTFHVLGSTHTSPTSHHHISSTSHHQTSPTSHHPHTSPTSHHPHTSPTSHHPQISPTSHHHTLPTSHYPHTSPTSHHPSSLSFDTTSTTSPTVMESSSGFSAT